MLQVYNAGAPPLQPFLPPLPAPTHSPPLSDKAGSRTHPRLAWPTRSERPRTPLHLRNRVRTTQARETLCRVEQVGGWMARGPRLHAQPATAGCRGRSAPSSSWLWAVRRRGSQVKSEVPSLGMRGVNCARFRLAAAVALQATRTPPPPQADPPRLRARRGACDRPAHPLEGSHERFGP